MGTDVIDVIVAETAFVKRFISHIGQGLKGLGILFKSLV